MTFPREKAAAPERAASPIEAEPEQEVETIGADVRARAPASPALEDLS